MKTVIQKGLLTTLLLQFSILFAESFILPNSSSRSNNIIPAIDYKKKREETKVSRLLQLQLQLQPPILQKTNHKPKLFILSAKKQQQELPKGGLSNARKKQLGVQNDEDEYDLGVALDANTDPLITKIIAGSAILAIMTLLVIGVIIPSISDFGDGVCVPIQNGGRC